uniref:Large ribosomal subunit protein bL17 n=1 Tax=candidate division WOR-3 bacterium TaxID=2052148 RepID=A0A7C3N5H7_UNCW3
MRHNDKIKKLSRTSEHRNAMLNNLVTSLFEKNVVITTTIKAKEARKLAEKLITFAKNDDSVSSRREVAKRLKSRKIVQKLFEEIAPKYKMRKGGYTRVINLGIRRGDGASTAILELVEKPEKKEKEKKEKKK